MSFNIRDGIQNIQNNLNLQNSKIVNLEDYTGINVEIFNKTKNACSQIFNDFWNTLSSGSGWFYYDTVEDLNKGYFVTAAHCVMETNLTRVYQVFIQNPITRKWITITPENIFVDGLSDIALIQTNIDFTNHPEYCLKLATENGNPGDICYAVGNPGMSDEDSISIGSIRDSHWTDPGGNQTIDTLFITSPGISGISGGPILNKDGDVIGIFTFAFTNLETFGGGANRDVLEKTLNILKNRVDNKVKRYLGIDWFLMDPLWLSFYYTGTNTFPTNGVFIQAVSSDSPFHMILGQGDILLEATFDNGETIYFGNNYYERTPGILVHYLYNTYTVSIKYKAYSDIWIDDYTTIRQATISLNKSYNDVPAIRDMYLRGNLSQNLKINVVKKEKEFNNVKELLEKFKK